MPVAPDFAILYIEHDLETRRVIEMLLRDEMNLTQLTVWEDSADFLTRIDSLDAKPDLILLDIHVQPLSGLDVFRLLRQHPSLALVPVVALSYEMPEDEIAVLRKAGFDGAITKPVDLAIFPETLNHFLNGEPM